MSERIAMKRPYCSANKKTWLNTLSSSFLIILLPFHVCNGFQIPSLMNNPSGLAINQSQLNARRTQQQISIRRSIKTQLGFGCCCDSRCRRTQLNVSKSDDGQERSKTDVKLDDNGGQEASKEDVRLHEEELLLLEIEKEIMNASGSDVKKSESGSTAQSLKERAKALQLKAKSLMKEAEEAEAELRKSKSSQRTKFLAESDAMIDHLFHRISGINIDVTSNSDENNISKSTKKREQHNNRDDQTGIALQEENIVQDVAKIFRDERWSPEQVLMVLERLHEQQIQAMKQKMATVTSPERQQQQQVPTSPSKTTVVVSNEAEVQRLESKIRCIIQATTILDEEYIDASSSTVTTENRKTSTKLNSRWTGRVATVLKARRKELLRTEEEANNRRLLLQATSAAKENSSNNNNVTTTSDYIRHAMGVPVTGSTSTGTSASTSTAATDQKPQVVNAKGNVNNNISSNNNSNNNGLNVTKIMEGLIMVPLWVPSPLLPYILSTKEKVQKRDVETIKEDILTGSQFYCTSYDTIPYAAIFRGNLRPRPSSVSSVASSGGLISPRNQTAMVFQEIQQRLMSHKDKELSERIQLFFIEDPEWRPGVNNNYHNSRGAASSTSGSATDLKPKPVILAIPKSVKPTASRGVEKITASSFVKKGSVVLTLLTTFAFAVSCYSLNERFFHAIIYKRDMSALKTCLPLFFSIIAIQTFHELAHYLVAKRSRLKIGKPTPLPSPQFGTFGCITPLLSFPKNRTQLYDLAISGPATALGLSIVMMIAGILATVNVSSASALLNFPVMPVSFLKSSFLTSWILMTLAPKALMIPLSQPIPLHPVFIAGFAGLISSALNLLPIFRLDGGRIVSALFGQRAVGFVSASTLLFMFSLVISGASTSGTAFLWGLMVVVFQRRSEVPLRDDVTEVNDIRLWSWILLFGTAIAALVPFPGGHGFL